MHTMLSRRHRLHLLIYTCFIAHTIKSFQIPPIFQNNRRTQAQKATINSPAKIEDVSVVVIVPGFMTGAEDFQPLARSLSKRGIPAAVVPMEVWHWIPCIGGQCMRPMLDRIDYTVQHVCSTVAKDSTMLDEVEEVRVPNYKYSVLDCVKDLVENLGRTTNHKEEEFPISNSKARGNFAFSMGSPAAEAKDNENEPTSQVRICLVGHSAGGWISRMYLSDRLYFGKSYSGTRFVHSLITLGTPHREAAGPAFNGIKWCNRERLPIRGVAVGGVGSPGDSSGDLTRHSYAFCGADETEFDGDGVTPVSSALALEGDDIERIKLHGVTHYPWSNAGLLGDLFMPDLSKEHKRGKRWYGDDEIVDYWAGFLKYGQK
uniref:GPI inositol-deacylase n=1 Tax=Helicotheca tamesis TaxID=374047 RepID=A0A7S2IJ96_9STRA|mmetsp:Transcript_9935/g.13903  ORF Transcript_9935/g.13903 Transcript_9935/m.13903 type:complete len:373 (+) Transcript_9935:27-1145(+)